MNKCADVGIWLANWCSDNIIKKLFEYSIPDAIATFVTVKNTQSLHGERKPIVLECQSTTSRME